MWRCVSHDCQARRVLRERDDRERWGHDVGSSKRTYALGVKRWTVTHSAAVLEDLPDHLLEGHFFFGRSGVEQPERNAVERGLTTTVATSTETASTMWCRSCRFGRTRFTTMDGCTR
jgi:hypothetical protein